MFNVTWLCDKCERHKQAFCEEDLEDWMQITTVYDSEVDYFFICPICKDDFIKLISTYLTGNKL